MSRISFRRTTPEGWQETIRRMVSLNGARLDPAQAREVVRYLATDHGLAPEEARPADFEVLRTTPDYKYEASADIESLCSRCHSMGRVISQRRTRREWELLIAMHRGYYPLVDNQSGPQSFRRPGPAPGPGPNGEPPDLRHPMDRAIDHLSKAFPLQTPQWAAWSATLRPPRLEGTWALSGWDRGRGPIYGRVTIARAEAQDEFTTETTYTYARTGETLSRSGSSIVYTGFQWRGRSQASGRESATLNEVMFVDRDWRTMDGRWFTGSHDEMGLEVRLDRAGDRTVLGVDRESLRAGASAQQIKIFGTGLPTSLQTSDVDFGPGVTVSRVVSATPELVTIVVDVAGSARTGRRDVVVAGAVRPAALAVYDKVDAIKVKPEWAMARVGGAVFPKMLAQFEAHAFHNGADGRPDTPDDVDLGLVNATWSLEEYAVTYDDDDVKFVGTIDAATGLFTPALDGPNPERSGNRNNVGDVWAVATFTPEPGKSALKARAHLLVTVPLYMRWEEPR
jgi:quinohemoprotein amine dehydrogenase